MAQAIYEKRSFQNQQTGETVKYEVYAIVADVDGERMELGLKNLSPAEKIAWKMVLSGDDPKELHATARSATVEEKDEFLANYKAKNEGDNENILD